MNFMDGSTNALQGMRMQGNVRSLRLLLSLLPIDLTGWTKEIGIALPD